MQCVEIELDPNETAIAEAGAFMMMDDGVQMATIFGDGTGQEKGFLGKLWSAGKRVLTGESLFMTAFTNAGQGKKESHICFTLSRQDHSNGPSGDGWKDDLPERFIFMCR